MSVKLTKKMRALLQLVADNRGVIDSSDYDRPHPMDPYCDDRGRETDTFNLAHDLGYLQTGHDSDSDTSTTYLTPSGRAALSPTPGGEGPGHG